MPPGGATFRLGHVGHPLPGGDEQRRKREDMTSVMTERDGAGQTLPAPAVPDLTLPQFVRLRDQGITPGFINHARARGYKTTDPDELVRLKNGGLYK